jgi:hypothetical protein
MDQLLEIASKTARDRALRATNAGVGPSPARGLQSGFSFFGAGELPESVQQGNVTDPTKSTCCGGSYRKVNWYARIFSRWERNAAREKGKRDDQFTGSTSTATSMTWSPPPTKMPLIGQTSK